MTCNKKVITKAEVREDKYQKKMYVEYEDGSSEDLFCWYPDELSFDEDDVLLKTREEALFIYHKRDTAYLRS